MTGARRVPRLRYRPVAKEDLPECFELWPEWLVLDAATRAAVPALFERLIDEPSLVSGVMEDVALPLGQRIQGWGVTLILPRAVTRGLRLHEQPPTFFASKIYDALATGRLAPMSDREIGQANARGELEMLILQYGQRQTDVTDPYVSAVVAISNDAFRAFHDGYALEAFYYSTSAQAVPIAVASGFEVCPMADEDGVAALPPARRPAFLRLTRERARLHLPGTPTRNCFEHQPPLFRFSASQRRMLWLTLFDDSDEMLMKALDVSVHGLKKLWRGIYERIEDQAPGFFGDGVPDTDGRRGPEKRRQALAYVRQRPEELRPWSPG